jgi:hypothetical protein
VNPSSDKLGRLIEGYALHCRYPDKLAAVMKLLEHDRMRPALADKFIRKIQPWIKKQIEEGNYLPMPPTLEDLQLEEEPFEVVLGNLIERPEVPFGIHLGNGVHHVIVCGKPNAGKSVTLRYYFLQVNQHGLLHPDQKAVVIFFDSKHDVPNPEKIFGENVVHCSVHDTDKFRIGLNGPLGVPWSGNISTLLGTRTGLVFSRGCFRTAYDWAISILNPHPRPDQPLVVPSARLLRDILSTSPAYCWGEKNEYVKTLVQALNTLLADAAGLLDAENGFDANAVIAQGKHCVIDIANLEPAYLRYIVCDIIILQILLYRIHHHLKTKSTKVCFGWDEADFFVQPSAQAVYPQGLSPITLLARLAREYGIQIFLSVSALQNVAPYLLSSTECLIAMGSVDWLSIACVRQALGLERGTERLLPRLRPGQAIVRLADSPYSYPFLGQVHYIEPDHSSKTRSYDAVPFTRARGLDELPEVQNALEERIRECSKNRLQRRQVGVPGAKISKTERTFIDQMSLNEFDTLDIVFAKMGNMAAGTQNKLVDSLVRKGLIEAKTVRTGRSWTRFGRITDKGWQYLGKTSRYAPLRGGMVHTNVTYLKQRLDMKNGFEKSFCEYRLEGSTGFHDVVSIRDGRYYVTEVVIDCDTNVVKHAHDCLLNSTIPVENLTIVTLLKSEHQKIRSVIMADPELVFCIDRITFLTVEDILKELYQ